MGPANGNVIGNDTKKGNQKTVGNLRNIPEQVNLNAYRIDLSEAHIYKYAINFEPKHSFSPKEKKQLARVFLSAVGIDTCNPCVVAGDNFEIFLPFPNLHLMQGGIQVPFARLTTSKGSYGKVLVGDSGAEPNTIWSHFRAVFDVQMETVSGNLDSKVPSAIDELQCCKVTAQGSALPLKMFHQNENENIQHQILGALDKIFQRDATVPPNGNGLGKFGASTTLLALGNNIFDLSGNPIHDGEGFQLRVGIKTSTKILDSGVFRIVSPTYGAFLAPMNLAEIVLQFCKKARWDGGVMERLEELLKGVTVTRNYGNGRVDVITGLGLSPSVQEVVWGGRGRTSVEDHIAQEHGHKIHSSYAHLPCVKTANPKSEEYLPMSVCQILPGQKAQLLLLMEMGILTEAELKAIERKGEDAAKYLRDDQNAFGRNFLYRAMSPQTFTAFNIKINVGHGAQHSVFWNKEHVKQAHSIPTQKLITSFEPLDAKSLRQMPLAIYLLTDEFPSDYAAIVAKLFKSYQMKIHDIFVLGKNVGSDEESLAASLEGLGEGVVFVLRSKARSKIVAEAYRQIKNLCRAGKYRMTVACIEYFSVSSQKIEETEKIAKAFRRLPLETGSSQNSANASAAVPRSTFSCVAVYVSALPEPDHANSECVDERGNGITRRKGHVTRRRFLVTVVVMNPKTETFPSRSFFQTCNIDSNATAGKVDKAGGDSFFYTGVQGLEADHAKAMKAFIQENMSGPDFTKLVVFRAGILPSQHGSNPSGLDFEISFFEEFARGKGYKMAYYSTSSTSSARLTLSSQPSELTQSALVVQPDYANSKKWLIQKGTQTGCPAGPITLTLHRGEEMHRDFFGSDSAVFSALWSFPPDVWSQKEIATVAVARKVAQEGAKTLLGAPVGMEVETLDRSRKSMEGK